MRILLLGLLRQCVWLVFKVFLKMIDKTIFMDIN